MTHSSYLARMLPRNGLKFSGMDEIVLPMALCYYKITPDHLARGSKTSPGEVDGFAF